MSKVFIEESTLSSIGDALRRKHGETKMGTVLVEKEVPAAVISKTPNATGFDSWEGNYDKDVDYSTFNETKTYLNVVHIPNAARIQVTIKVALNSAKHPTGNWRDIVSIYAGNHPKNDIYIDKDIVALFDYTDNNVKTIKTIDGEYVSFGLRIVNITKDTTNMLGYYAECVGLDAEGNPLGTQIIEIEEEVEVKNTYNPLDVPEAIDNIGGLPEEALVVSGNCTYRFSNNGWNWFIQEYGDIITTQDITNAERMFAFTTGLEEIPFKLNCKNQEGISLNYAFHGMRIKKPPVVNIPNVQKSNLGSVIANCDMLRDANGLFENEEEFGASWQGFVNTTSFGNHYLGYILSGLYSLRTVPSWFYLFRLNPESTAFPYMSYSLYSRAFNGCYALDEIKDIPVWTCKGAQTSNMFDSTFESCFRVKDITFETNADGTPIVTSWKTQTIDLSKNAGYTTSSIYISTYNSGITADKEVKDDATYAALKDDHDWFTCNIAYSRYNKISAINTINSLPDTSAYLASAGGTNTIKFKGAAGEKTDGGAINTMTEEEIAVATAKGWTVSFV